MARCAHASFSIFLCVLGILGIVHGQRDCTGCYQMDGVAIAAIIVGDIIITVLIALAVFFLARKLNAKKNGAGEEFREHAGWNYEKQMRKYGEPEIGHH
ncbi:TYRO protein tyrosine kinase-binding protein isoform X2 [Microcaecilia unicolor]|uniref:TYRO protein tyrosine kinase-binding protein n=1 Tax=Microcaecilia unicolor TaxID=1415580 RepID=A0A6P7YZ46_9AMPH|nr:TYRO protein tyrosine kinase-binding protein-like isoform X2 [Microcaecilia unicolor]